jgi:hypothetical protein
MTRPSKDRSKSARDAVSPQSARGEQATSRLTARLRLLISAVVVYHLSAVFIGAWIGSPPTSPFADAVARPFRSYIAVADLNHGYRFFAPNPGPSHLFRYRLTYDDGSTSDGYFPNRSEHWPRLLYHRYFMLSENLNVLRPNGPVPSAVDGNNGRASLPASPARQELRPPAPALRGFRALADSYATELLRQSGAVRIDWEFVRHYQPPPDDVLAGRSLTGEEYYESLDRGSLERSTDEELP